MAVPSSRQPEFPHFHTRPRLQSLQAEYAVELFRAAACGPRIVQVFCLPYLIYIYIYMSPAAQNPPALLPSPSLSLTVALPLPVPHRPSLARLCVNMEAFATTSGRSVLPSSTSVRAPSASRLLATPRRRRAGVGSGQTMAFGAATGWGAMDSGPGFGTLSQLASAAGFAIGAIWFSRELALEQERNNQNTERCNTCQGTGRVPCICQRWSDNDVGCASCQNSGFAVCNDCRGGGTKVPVARVAPIYVDDKSKYRPESDPYRRCEHQCQPSPLPAGQE
mmetsp:Transcript_36505/g.91729  ORF Transcript_36505/g.91729 Transcript_36505/m.91729 type:complete len:278 (+) Transcript_36505:453-1286(+)